MSFTLPPGASPIIINNFYGKEAWVVMLSLLFLKAGRSSNLGQIYVQGLKLFEEVGLT